MADDGHLVEIIHSGPAEMPVGNGETGRLDDMGLDVQAGAEPQNRPGVLRDVRLKKDNTHRKRPSAPVENFRKNLRHRRF